jgi:uncharacterized protein YwbE
VPIDVTGKNVGILHYQKNLITFVAMKTTSFIFLILISFLGKSQTLIPGQVYYGVDSFIEYRTGNLPIILSAPHGGYLSPNSLPDRNCVGCVTGRDSYTQELTREIEAAILAKTGCYPHVIINKLHRKKLDANRDIIEATDSNLITEPFWNEYMNFIDTARNKVYREYPKGIFLDIHGHGHSIQRIELGYLISGNSLRQNDSAINTFPISTNTSILNLKFSSLNAHSLAELIRSEHSFGAMIQRRGFPAVPSDSIPSPLVGEPFFDGGHNTKRFGSVTGGTIDAIQIESHQGVRFISSTRAKYADSLATAILEYLEYHYFADFSNGYCNYLTSIDEKNEINPITIFPNPTSGIIFINGISQNIHFKVLDIRGNTITSGKFSENKKINLSSLDNGVYFVQIKQKNFVNSFKVIKK